jgi:SAM-dependent methyltransferase
MESAYVSDVPYTAHFYAELSPVALNLIAVANGFAPCSIAGSFNYCELGCGHGFTTNILATCFPNGHFFGVDLMSTHVKAARRFAVAGNVKNVSFLESDFAALAKTDLPQFDFIAIHGVYSWVGDAVQSHIRNFIRSRLKPGGLVYVSYNALPGWSALLPLRDMMLAYTRHLPGDSIEKARHGLSYLEYLRTHGSEYFAKTPNAAAVLDDLKRQPINYVVHEYFHSVLVPMYFSEVAADLSEAGCVFVGNTLLRDNFPNFALPKQFQDVARTAPNREAFEVHKDFVRDTRFRRDVFVKPNGPVLGPAERSMLAQDLCFGPGLRSSSFNPVARFGALQLHLTGPIFPRLARALQEGSKTFAQLRASPDLVGFPAPKVWEAMILLLISEQAMPYAEAAARVGDIAISGEGPPLEFPTPFNQVALEEKLFDGPPPVVAAPALGSGIELCMAEALALLALSQVSREEAAQWGCEFLKRHNRPLISGGKRVDGDDATLHRLRQTIDTLLAKRLSKFVQLRVVRTAGA